MAPILDFGVRFIILLQGLGSWLEAPMKLFSFLGTEDFFMVALPIIYWCYDTTLGMQVGMILMLSNSINGFLKVSFHGPRPYWISPLVKGLGSETSFGLPSNHAQSAAVLWGIVAAYLRKGWAWWGAGVLVFLISFSRLYLGVHFPHDVLVGLALGLLLLWLVVRFWKPAAEWVKTLSPGRRVWLAFLASLALTILPLIPLVWLTSTGWQPPQEWAAYASQALSFQDVFTYSGTLFGLLGGLIWIHSMGGFQTKGSWSQLLLRFLVGVAGVLAIRYGLKAVFSDGETIVAYLFRYIRYTAIGFWVTGAAPWCFVRLKLARPLELVNITVSLRSDTGTPSDI